VIVRVITGLRESDDSETTWDINFAEHTSRYWLNRHMIWALNNARWVELMAVSSDGI